MKMGMLSTTIVVTMMMLSWHLVESFNNPRKSARKCQKITIPMCKSVGYNLTYMPNQFNHDHQEEAGLEVHQFWPLVKIKCSPYLRLFLCSMYAPICLTNYDKPLPVCRHVCEEAKKGCAPLMRQYGFPWPPKMNCEQLPIQGDPQRLCMHMNTESTTSRKPSIPTTTARTRMTVSGGTTKPPSVQKSTRGSHRKIPCTNCCNTAFFVKINKSHPLYGKISTGGAKNCALKCENAYFNEDDQFFATVWVGLWSVLCAISTLITFLTFLIDVNRFKYPERPIMFLSACYFMMSIGYIIRLIAGSKLSCHGAIIRYESTGPPLCSVVFFLIYYFGMSSSIWWVILTFTWFLAAGAKWAAESIQRFSQYFHAIAWSVPIVKTIIVFATSSVDGDPVAGICYVGNQNMNNLIGFVVGPLCVYLFLGTCFLLAGFFSMCRIRNEMRHQGVHRTKNLERLMVRIGVFGLLYTIPATIVIACYFYERHIKSQWQANKNCANDPNCREEVSIDFSVFMLKYFMCLIVGLASGFWISSRKTAQSWRTFWGKLSVTKRNTRDKYTVYYQPPLLKPIASTTLNDI